MLAQPKAAPSAQRPAKSQSQPASIKHSADARRQAERSSQNPLAAAERPEARQPDEGSAPGPSSSTGRHTSGATKDASSAFKHGKGGGRNGGAPNETAQTKKSATKAKAGVVADGSGKAQGKRKGTGYEPRGVLLLARGTANFVVPSCHGVDGSSTVVGALSWSLWGLASARPGQQTQVNSATGHSLNRTVRCRPAATSEPQHAGAVDKKAGAARQKRPVVVPDSGAEAKAKRHKAHKSMPSKRLASAQMPDQAGGGASGASGAAGSGVVNEKPRDQPGQSESSLQGTQNGGQGKAEIVYDDI